MTTSQSEDAQHMTTSPSKDAQKMPDLRYHDQTPLAKADNKRLCSALSREDNESDLTKTVQEVIQAAVATSMPDIIKTIQDQLTTKTKPPLMRALKV